MEIDIVNFRGEKEPFSWQKVYLSAKRAGAADNLARKIADEIQKIIYPGIETAQIFAKVKEYLAKEDPRSTIRFSLKKAIQKLGPTGFPFEKYIGALWENQGFKVKLNQFIAGRCLEYEIDFLAEKDDLIYIGECKYRNSLFEQKIHSDTVLAIFARFLDISEGNFFKTEKFKNFRLKPILVTDAKFTESSIKFAQCRQIELWGWRYPSDHGLEFLIEKQNLYPITILPSLDDSLAEVLISKRIVLVRDLLKVNAEEFSKAENIAPSRLETLINEGKILLNSK
jgi:hypothetical protein